MIVNFSQIEKIMKVLLKKENLLYFIFFMFFFFFSISNNIGFGKYNFKFYIPDFINDFANIFRSSGRMFWPFYYLIFFGTIAFTIKNFDKKVAVFLLGITLIIQIFDTSKGWLPIRKSLLRESRISWQEPFSSDFYKFASKKYKKVYIVPLDTNTTENNSVNWKLVSRYAALNRLSTNSAKLARVDSLALQKTNNFLNNSIETGIYDKYALYFIDEHLVEKVIKNKNNNDLLIKIISDGSSTGYVLAPNWYSCKQCEEIQKNLKLEEYTFKQK
jgi:hypothetical protein